MIYLGVPVMDGHELTESLLDSIEETVADPHGITVVIVDNNSLIPYGAGKSRSFVVRTIRNEKNLGYYQPMAQLAAMATSADIVGLCHNDILIYEEGWDLRVREAFLNHGKLGMVGFVGSDEADHLGGRGGGTMCYFRGERGQSQDAGKRVTGLHPACLLDSVVMFTRASLVPLLCIDSATPICHFVDKIWPMRLLTHGIPTAVLGVEMDHMGGMTAVANPRFEESCKEWCAEHKIPVTTTGGAAVYNFAETLFLSEFRRRGMIPGRMNGWVYRRV